MNTAQQTDTFADLDGMIPPSLAATCTDGQPTNAAHGRDSAAGKRRITPIVWKGYFCLMCALFLLTLPDQLTGKTTTLVDGVDALFSLISLVVLFGWAWRRPIGRKSAWVVFTVLFVVESLVYNLFFHAAANHAAWQTSWPEALTSLVLLVPIYVATVLYVLHFDEL